MKRHRGYETYSQRILFETRGCGEEEWKQCEHHSCSRKDAEREASRLRDIGERTGRTRNVTIVPEIHRVAVTY